jgi:sucrose-6-phosphate hydrolase SacC (GH32 family)
MVLLFGVYVIGLHTCCIIVACWMQGRQLLYGWMQEHRRVPTPPALCDDFCYAGCISTPRVLRLLGDKLYQSPLPEINALRTR